MDDEGKILPLLEKMYLTFNKRFENLETNMGDIKSRLTSIENTVVKIENSHGQKLAALFDGYTLNSEKLDRIEKEVSKHEEIILRRIR